MTLFVAGLFVGGSLVYTWLRWECARAYERLGQTFESEVNRKP